MDGEYRILWNNYHEALVNTLCTLQQEEDLANVTLVCGDGSKLMAHQLILSACSSFLRSFLRANPSKHPIVLLPTEIQYADLKAMIEFMYTGQVCVSQDRLQSFMRGARYLRIKGVDGTIDESVPETECLNCHSKSALPYDASPSMKYLCSVCSTSDASENKIKRKAKRRLVITDRREEQRGKVETKKIKLEQQEEVIELHIGHELTEEEPHKIHSIAEDKTDGSVTVSSIVEESHVALKDEAKECVTVKSELHGASNSAVFKVLGIFGVTGRKKRYTVTEAELRRRQGSPEHFSNNAMKTYLRFPRTQDSLPERLRTHSQRKTTLSTFTNIIEGEIADLAKDFQRFLFASNLLELLSDGIDDMSGISEVMDHMLDNLTHVDWNIKFNLLTHGAGLHLVRTVLLYVRSAAR